MRSTKSRSKRCVTTRRVGRERGAALVEFAIVFPLFFLLVSGIIDFGLAFSDLNSSRQGVREGARHVVVASFGDDSSCSIVGADPSAASRKAICLTKDRIGLSDSDTRVKIVFPGLNQVGDSIVVCAQRPMRSTTGVFTQVMAGRALTTKVQMRIEKVDPELEATAETPLPGTDWSWCV